MSKTITLPNGQTVEMAHNAPALAIFTGAAPFILQARTRHNKPDRATLFKVHAWNSSTGKLVAVSTLNADHQEEFTMEAISTSDDGHAVNFLMATGQQAWAFAAAAGFRMAALGQGL